MSITRPLQRILAAIPARLAVRRLPRFLTVAARRRHGWRGFGGLRGLGRLGGGLAICLLRALLCALRCVLAALATRMPARTPDLFELRFASCDLVGDSGAGAVAAATSGAASTAGTSTAASATGGAGSSRALSWFLGARHHRALVQRAALDAEP